MTRPLVHSCLWHFRAWRMSGTKYTRSRVKNKEMHALYYKYFIFCLFNYVFTAYSDKKLSKAVTSLPPHASSRLLSTADFLP